jgi:hypothetical protein
MTDRTGGELIQDFLATYEIPFVFGNPGTTETTFLAAIAASKATYVLSLHESSAVGIAAGYALITGRPSLVSGMFNMRNALMAGVPLLVVNGQQDSRFLIHSAACCVYRHGEKVVNLWGGIRKNATGEPWEAASFACWRGRSTAGSSH